MCSCDEEYTTGNAYLLSHTHKLHNATARAKHWRYGGNMTTYVGVRQTDSRRHCSSGAWRQGLSRRQIGRHLFLLVCLLAALETTYAASIYNAYNASEEAHAKVDGTTFLMKFGYLPQSDRETGALRTAEELNKAVETFQRYAQLPVTGRLDRQTLQKMLAKRCGVADITQGKSNAQHVRRHWYRRQFRRHLRHKRYAFGPSKWEHVQVTYRILNYTPKLDLHEIRRILHEAFLVWSRVTLLNFVEVMQGHADIMIQFARGYHGDGYPFDGRGMILAHAFFPGEERGGDVHFDDDEMWTSKSEDGVNLFGVAAHEIGHSLGLAHSSVPGSLMYPWYQGYTENFQLHSDDIAGIQYLYGYRGTATRPPHVTPGRRTTTTPARTRPTTTTTTTTTQTVPWTSRPHPGSTTAPDLCRTSIDAATVIRKEVFIFKGKWFWRRDETGVMPGYPVEFNRFWYGLPDTFNKVDAVYERIVDGKIVFFSGRNYWIFDGNHPAPGFSREGRPITELGIPNDVDHIDAAFVWGYNKKTYLISGDMYWRYNEDTGSVEDDYPRDMSMWAGVPVPVSAAFQYWDGLTYFFHGEQYWQFKDARMQVRSGYPQPIGSKWLNCDARYDVLSSADEQKDESSKASGTYFYTTFLIASCLVHVVLL